METTKRRVADLEMVYAVCATTIGGKTRVLAATESHGACVMATSPDWAVSEVWDGPGGTMNLAPVHALRYGQAAYSGSADAVLAIQGFFPVFQSEGAGIVLAQPDADPTKPWNMRRIADLPFVHRIEVTHSPVGRFLVAASLCGGKDHRDDWSKPGAVYTCPIPSKPDGDWRLTPILSGVSKNHGLHSTVIGGRRTVLVCGTEGMFALTPPELRGEAWGTEKLLAHEVSDVVAADIDADGDKELIAIEPFHGDRLVVYKCRAGTWEPVAETRVNFGHALWAGLVHDKPRIIFGNRGGRKELAAIRVEHAGGEFLLKRTVLDEGVGPAQVTVFRDRGTTWILSANHGIGEVAMYEVME